MKFLFTLLTSLWIMVTLSPDVQANYTFLQNLQNYERTESGVHLFCENNVEIEIRFLKPGMFRWTLIRPGYQEPLLDYPLAKTNWDPVALKLTEEAPHLILSTKEMNLIIHKLPCRITVLDKQGNVINKDDPGMGVGWDGKEVRCWKSLAKDERFFGLGEKTGDLNKRGREWVMWNSDFPAYDNQTDPLYQSIPFYIGMHENRTYGIYFNNSYRATFNMGAGNRRYSSFAAEQGNLDYFFMYGPEVGEVVADYTELTGRIVLPPRWALGYQQCRWSYYPDTEVLNLAQTFRDKQIPADVIYLDIHYMDGYRVFTWDKDRFPNPAGMLRELQNMGFKVVTIIDPGVKADSAFSVAKEGIEHDHFVKYPDGEVYVGEVWPGASFFPDFSRPETRRWWGEKLVQMMNIGVDGFWNDMNEPAVWGRAFPLEVLMYDKGRTSSQKKMHNLYAFMMSQAANDAMLRHSPNRRPFLVTRAGFAGEQRFTAVWTGDNVASEDHLELGIRMMLGLGLSGVPFVGTDVGGFAGTPSPELFARWIQVGVFSPFFRTHTEHGTPHQEPWSFGEEVEHISRKFISLRYRMLPYLYTLFWEASESGTPILRPMFWYFQDDPNVYKGEYQHQFLVGENLLIAPVTRVGHYLKEVYLPDGDWIDLNTEEVYAGSARIVVDAPLDRLPMFLRGGGIIPSQEVRQYVGQPADSCLILDIFPSGDYGSLLHYEDDGETFNHQTGEYRLTQVEYLREGDHLTLSKRRVQDQYEVGERMLEARFHAFAEEPEEIELRTNKLYKINKTQEELSGYFYDEEQKILTIRIPDTGAEQSVQIR